MKKSISIADYLSPLILVSLILVWALAVWIFHIEPWILPSPYQVLQELYLSAGLLWQNSLITVLECIIGLIIGTTIGITTATLIHWSRAIGKSLYPLIVVSQTIPFIALAPLLTIWLGFGLLPKILIVALVTFFPITMSLIEGFSQIDRSTLRTFEAMGASKGQIFGYITIPSSISHFFSGLRIATAYAFLSAVIAEWIGAKYGLGIMLTRASRSFLVERVFATVVVITIISLLMIWIVDKLHNFSTPWIKNTA